MSLSLVAYNQAPSEATLDGSTCIRVQCCHLQSDSALLVGPNRTASVAKKHAVPIYLNLFLKLDGELLQVVEPILDQSTYLKKKLENVFCHLLLHITPTKPRIKVKKICIIIFFAFFSNDASISTSNKKHFFLLKLF